MNGSNWQVEHQCPQCGAPVVLDETFRILSCPYCRTRLYIEPGDHFRHCIPSRVSAGEMINLPYWRCKGSCFSFRGFEANHRFLDANLSGLAVPGVPESLGLRPQALRMKFVSPELPGQFLPPRLTLPQIMARITETHVPGGSFYRFIGELTSLVYSPFYRKQNVLYDAVTDRPALNISPSADEWLKETAGANTWRVRFVSTLCPQCGWDLEGDRDALVLICRNCNRAWRCEEGELKELAFAAVEHPQAVLYLPFWRLRVRMDGIDLDSYADLIRVANLPKAVTPASERKPFFYWLPAFKVNPQLYLRTARQMTIYQPEGDMTATFSAGPRHPVNLAESEALEGVAVVTAEIATDKRRLLPVLAKAKAVKEDSLLIYHPFVMKYNELVHAYTGMAMDRNALAFGAAL